MNIVAALTRDGVGTCGADDNQAQGSHLVAATLQSGAKGWLQTKPGEHIVALPLNAHGRRDDFDTETLIAHTLKDDGFDAGEDGSGRGVPLVTGYQQDVFCVPGGISPALAHSSAAHKGHHQPKIVSFNWQGGGNQGDLGCDENLSGALHVGQTPAVAFTVSEQANGYAWLSEVHPTLQAHPQSESSQRQVGIVAAVQDSQSGVREHETSGALRSDAPGTQPSGTLLRTGMTVRRLTPRECERLQGFPDDYTLVPYRGKPAADGPRYRAIGNSMATPVMLWIGRRIQQVEELLIRLKVSA